MLKSSCNLSPESYPVYFYLQSIYSGSASKGNMRIVVYDMKGVIVSSKYINKTQLGVQRTLNIANLKSGTYFIAIIAQQSEKRMLKPFVKLP